MLPTRNSQTKYVNKVGVKNIEKKIHIIRVNCWSHEGVVGQKYPKSGSYISDIYLSTIDIFFQILMYLVLNIDDSVGEIVNGKLYLLLFLIFPMLNTIEDWSRWWYSFLSTIRPGVHRSIAIHKQQILDYWDLNYRDPLNTGIDKKIPVT